MNQLQNPTQPVVPAKTKFLSKIVSIPAFSLRTALIALVGFSSYQASAVPISIYDPYHWLENRSFNTLGRPTGLRQNFGVDTVLPNGLGGTTATATQGSIEFTLPYTGTSAIPNEFNRTIAADPSLYGAWTLQFKNGTDIAMVTTPAITPGLKPMPFVSDVAIRSGASTSFSWKTPTTTPSPVNAVRINIFDHGRLNRAGTSADIVYNITLPATIETFTLPSILATGAPLTAGNLYTVELNLLSYEGGVVGSQSNLRNRSRYYVDFVGGSTAGHDVFLPVVEKPADGSSPIFHFSVADVGTDRIFIDPVVALGYEYKTGAGDPNFASVLLPTGIGDNLYTIKLADGTLHAVTGGSVFQFASGGVSNFTVLGIEESAGLNPADTTAFVTGLTFAGAGSFTGTMAAVPEPSQFLMWGAGLVSLFYVKCRNKLV